MVRFQVALCMALLLAACGSPHGNGLPYGGDPSGQNVDRDGGDPGSSGDTQQTGDTPTGSGVELNPGWIGGSCNSVNDCGSAQFDQTPICETTGFPNGMCTQAANQNDPSNLNHYTCPDEDWPNPASLYTITRPISVNGAGWCVSECDFDKSLTGCRPGYACVRRERHGEPLTIHPVCLPETDQIWPGETALAVDIGDACTTDNDCASLYCLNLSNGYCTKTMCGYAGCPTGSTCYIFETAEIAACLDDCTGASDCRESEGYVCLSSENFCWPDPTPPAWNASVGPGDCSAAWGMSGNALHSCDTVPDDYVVVNKAARNLALCNSGAEVASFNIGLGYTPVGDKEREGDGKTPEGVFYLPRLIDPSQYYKAFLLSYPDSAAAAAGVTANTINTTEQAVIDAAQSNCTEPPQNTGLGGLIEIHGMGGGQDWTWGCIAVANNEVDQIWSVLELGDTIVVLP